jgi:DNA-binding transcriptional LysR family regulator
MRIEIADPLDISLPVLFSLFACLFCSVWISRMTLDQLRIFVAVADRQHLTEGARAENLSPSAATAAIQALEGRHGTKLFNRVGRRLELSEEGRLFLPQARAVLGAAAAAQTALEELAGLVRGRLALAASQTLAGHWLPPIVLRFAARHPSIAVTLVEGNTTTVAAAVRDGTAELGCIEGAIDEPALSVVPLADDRLVVVASPSHPLAGRQDLSPRALAEARWVMRETGSGTRAVLEAALASAGIDPETLPVALTLPSNEAVCAAVAGSGCLAAVSELVARPHLQAGRLQRLRYALPPRRFALVRHKERFRTRAAAAFETVLLAEARALARQQALPDYAI